MPRVFGHYVPATLLALITAEALIVFGSVFVGLLLPLFGLPAVQPAWGDAIPAAAALTLLVLATGHIAGVFDLRQGYGRRELFLRLALSFVTAYLGSALLSYLVQSHALARKAVVLSGLVAFPSVFALRLLHDRLTADSRRRQQVLILGSGRLSRLVAATVREAPHSYELIGCLDAAATASTNDGELRSLGTIEDLARITKVVHPDVIVVALEERRGMLPVADIVDCKMRGIEVDDWPSFYEKITGRIPLSDLRPSWLVFADGFRPARLTRLTKRAMDIILSAVGLLLFAPLFALIAAAIRLDSAGPALFRQVPQLINVLLGDMSFVGPRPEWTALVPEFSEKVPLYLHRLAVKPGITGWAQVKNPYGSTVENTWEKLQYDLYYIKNISLFLDLLILLHTIQIVLFTKGSGAWTKTQRPSTTSVSYAA
jgi:hypothetical protein